jgi:hypothetical protein
MALNGVTFPVFFPAAAGPQKVMGGLFIVMGGVCLLAPRKTLQLGFNRKFRNLPGLLSDEEEKAAPAAVSEDAKAQSEALTVTMQCFGAQAVLCGTLLCTSRLDKRGYLIWGAAMLPFFVFDYIAYKRGILTPMGALGDAAGNVVFTVASAIGGGLFDRFLKA